MSGCRWRLYPTNPRNQSKRDRKPANQKPAPRAKTDTDAPRKTKPATASPSRDSGTRMTPTTGTTARIAPTEAPNSSEDNQTTLETMSELSSHSMTDSKYPECPTCGRDDFENQRGMKVHHSRAHGASLSDREQLSCPSCETTYTGKGPLGRHMRDCCPAKLHECPKCGKGCPTYAGVKNHYARVHDGSISGEPIECQNCGEIKRVRRDRDRDFCSRKCYLESLPDRVTVSCEVCGVEWDKKPSHVDGLNFCTKDCFNTYTSETDWCAGENNPRYNGGSKDVYGPNWDEQREKARERDNYTCQGCGVSEEQLSRELSVHHIVPRREYRDGDDFDYEEANRLDNLISHCSPCHIRWENIPVQPRLLPSE